MSQFTDYDILFVRDNCFNNYCQNVKKNRKKTTLSYSVFPSKSSVRRSVGGLTVDRFWLNQDIIYNFRSEIHGTGSWNEITVKSSLLSRAKRLLPAPVFFLRLRLRHQLGLV